MGLLQKSVETYDAMEHLAGVIEEGKEPLAPIGHICTRAAVEISIDRNGNFIQARKTNQKIIIPVTEKSSGRTSAPEAHPLCEQIGYIDGKDEKKKTLFLNQLKKWCEFDNNVKLSAVYKYVSNGNIIRDLDQADILVYDDKGSIKNEKDLVCWRVVGIDEADSAVWTDRTIHDSFIDFWRSQNEDTKKEISYISGRAEIPAMQHLKGVFSLAGNAKIISSNDTTNFTYRGRFLDSEEALSISYTDSQKAHNALKWIVANQGVTVAGRSFVCWNPKGAVELKPLLPIFRDDETKRTPTEYKRALYNTVMGYKSGLPQNADIVIAAFDAATSGRLAITYYNELQASDFLDRLKAWDEWCCWYDNRWGTSSPSLNDISKFSFGIQKGTDDIAQVEIEDKLMGQTIQRLLASRMDMSLFPTDIMRALVQKSSRPESYNKKNINRLHFITCAVVRKYRHDRFKEEWDMALEPGNKDRSYQFGRLLAVMEKAEKDAYREGETRETNAIRMQSVFVQRPGYATKIIMDQLKNAYYPHLELWQRNYYEKLIGEIIQVISESGEEQYNKPLSETYILGYYLQKNDFYTKKIKVEEEE